MLKYIYSEKKVTLKKTNETWGSNVKINGSCEKKKKKHMK